MGREAEEKCTDQIIKGKESTNNPYCKTLFIGLPALIVLYRRSFDQSASLAGHQHLRPPKHMGDFTNLPTPPPLSREIRRIGSYDRILHFMLLEIGVALAAFQ